MTLRETAIAFLKLAGMGEARDAFQKYVAPQCIHHNPYFEGSRSALLHAMEEDHRTHPNIAIEIKHSYSDGDTVITHSHVQKADMEIAVVHIFRFENGKIIEIWDVGQVLEEDSPNQHGPF